MDAPGPLMAYLAGVAAIAAPCTLVLVPFFLLYLAGSAVLQERVAGGPSLPTRFAGLWFGLGFLVAFVLVWSFPNAIEAVVRWSGLLERAGGIVLIALGVAAAASMFLGAALHARVAGAGLLLAVLIGATFAAGWTPCVGRTLSRILGLTGGPQGLMASLLLLVYGLGLMTPFVALGWAASWPARWLARDGVRGWAGPVAGLGLVGGGLVVVTGNLRDLTAYLFALAPRLAL